MNGFDLSPGPLRGEHVVLEPLVRRHAPDLERGREGADDAVERGEEGDLRGERREHGEGWNKYRLRRPFFGDPSWFFTALAWFARKTGVSYVDVSSN